MKNCDFVDCGHIQGDIIVANLVGDLNLEDIFPNLLLLVYAPLLI